MVRDVITAIEIGAPQLAQAVSEVINRLPHTQMVQWTVGMAERGPSGVKVSPDILVIDEGPQAGDLLKRLPVLIKNFPRAAIFVISEDQRPQHIVDVMKAGAAEYLVAPVDGASLNVAVTEVRNKLSSDGKITKGTVHSFISSKGGLGSTVIAVNLATALARDKKDSVGICDMSFQAGDSSVLLDLSTKTTIMDICRNSNRLDAAFLRGVMASTSAGIDFLAAPNNPEDSEEIQPEHISKILQTAKKLYDHIVIDCTSMFVGDCTVEAFRASDKVFVVTDLSIPAVRNAARLCLLIQKVGIDSEKIEIVVNRYIKGGAISLEEVEKTLRKKIYWLFPNDFDEIISSINRGIPLVKNHPNSPFSCNVFDFVEKIHNPQSAENYRGIRGAFGKAI